MIKFAFFLLFLTTSSFAYDLKDVKYIYWNSYTSKPDAYMDNSQTNNNGYLYLSPDTYIQYVPPNLYFYIADTLVYTMLGPAIDNNVFYNNVQVDYLGESLMYYP